MKVKEERQGAKTQRRERQERKDTLSKCEDCIENLELERQRSESQMGI